MTLYKNTDFKNTEINFDLLIATHGYKRGDTPCYFGGEYTFVLVENDARYIDCEYQDKTTGMIYSREEVNEINKMGRRE